MSASATGRLALLVAAGVLMACSALAQPDTPQASEATLTLPLRQFADEKGVPLADLQRELGLPADTDPSLPVAQVLDANGLSPEQLREAVLKAKDAGGSQRPSQEGTEAPPQPGSAGSLDMAFNAFASARGVSAEALASALGLPADADLSQPVGSLLKRHGKGPADMQKAMAALDPVAREAATKNWGKIRLKFALWVLAFLVAMVLLARVKVRPAIRAPFLAASALVFGVWLGVEPNAPGTVKDALVLYGESGILFPPRMVALVGFLLMSLLGNKVFCGWCCQFGTLQDLVWHARGPKLKPPFWLSNTVRVVFFVAMALAALVFGTDILEPVDPFRVFRLGAPVAVAVAGIVLLAGLYVYRPWCTFFCPFGLVSWLAERVSVWRPRVNHDTCINCRACERACPTHSMEGLRARRSAPQDCFACGACIAVCPVHAVAWGVRPPRAGVGEATQGGSQD